MKIYKITVVIDKSDYFEFYFKNKPTVEDVKKEVHENFIKNSHESVKLIGYEMLTILEKGDFPNTDIDGISMRPFGKESRISFNTIHITEK